MRLRSSLRLTSCAQLERLTGSGGGAPPSSVPFQTVNADGWTVTASDPAAAVAQTVTVQRQGFDAAGLAVTVNDVLTCTKRLRLPFPDQASLTADGAVLSDYVYAGDIIAGAANESARPYPTPISHWLRPDKEIISASTYTARLVVAHAHARNGRPVAAVRFRVTDGVTTVEQMVSALTPISYSASGFTVPHFAAGLDLSGFANGATLTVDAVIYPWVGAAFTISTDADAYPSPNLTTLRALCNRTGAFGTAYAYVDAAGAGATPTVSTNPATAAANPYATLDAAATALRAFNNANFGRNFTDGGVIRLLEGTHIFSAPIRTPGVTTEWPLTIEAANPGAVATTILRDRGTTMQSSLPNQCVFRNLTIQRSGTGSFVAYDNVAGNLNYAPVMVFDGCAFDANGAGGYAGYIYRTGNGYFINCTEISPFSQAARLATVNKTVKTIGCNGSFALAGTTYAVAGSRCVTGAAMFGQPGEVAGAPEGAGCLAAFSHFTNTSNGSNTVAVGGIIGPRGFGVVGCVVEASAGATSAAFFVNADSNVNTTQNVVVLGNTTVGSRLNYLYQDIGTVTVQKSGYLAFNAMLYRNTKTDVFGANANLTGNWSAVHNVGSRYNAWKNGANNGSGYGVGSWMGEVQAAGEVYGTLATPLNFDFALDASFDGTGMGGGDYTPGAATALPTVPATLAPHSHDMLGRALGDGWYVGALQAA
ncbi:MAG: hypothetical protein Q7J44_14150 [Pseudotabrizicola sp.]|uniref:hypothetical protein n=1 Tax=Pseudotabrizicola sp. TaxID=2939647 RepID=UPI002722B2B4|nr:hypothetical protein [Pseudotabrizicola sp.]MDO9639678.1 hypothetical protein [Pseudotabrizicola sp.]